MYDQLNKLFDLAIKGEGHNGLILISETWSCLNTHTYKILKLYKKTKGQGHSDIILIGDAQSYANTCTYLYNL